MLEAATRPVILAGRASRSIDALERARRAGRALGARVVTDLKIGAAFPTDHPLHVGAPAVLALSPEAQAALSRRPTSS